MIGDDSPLGSGVSIGLPPDEGTSEATFSATELIVARNGKGTMTVSSTGLAQIGSLEIGNDPDGLTASATV